MKVGDVVRCAVGPRPIVLNVARLFTDTRTGKAMFEAWRHEGAHFEAARYEVWITVGSLVALNKLPDAAWFRVEEIDGHSLTIREDGLENAAIQYTDRSLVAQVKQS